MRELWTLSISAFGSELMATGSMKSTLRTITSGVKLFYFSNLQVPTSVSSMWIRIIFSTLKRTFQVTSRTKEMQNKQRESTPQLFLYRHKDRNFIINKMNNLDWEANDDTKDLSKQDKYSLEQLRAMQLVAKMKESADRMGAGFVGGFISPTGERFMMSNVDADDIQHHAIKMRLDVLQAERQDELDTQDFWDQGK
jgi:hypothetical protein